MQSKRLCMCVADKGCVLLLFAGGRPFPGAMEAGVSATTACDRTYVLYGCSRFAGTCRS